MGGGGGGGRWGEREVASGRGQGKKRGRQKSNSLFL